MGKSAARVTRPEVVPPLRDGDRLTVREFMRRYEATPDGFRAELIKGVVYVNRWVERGPGGETRVMPPIGGGGHGREQNQIGTVFGTYAAFTPSVTAYSPVTLVLPVADSAVEPDALLHVLPEAGGKAGLGPDNYLHGPPELVAEIARTSVQRDLGVKLEAYERNGVAEYLVWRTSDRAVDWFRLNRAGRYVPLPADDTGVVRSRVFPGLWLDVAALLAGDMVRVLAVAQQGIASPEHAAFIEKLRKTAARKKR